MQSLAFYIKNKRILATAILLRLNALVPEKLYLKCLFRLSVGYKLDLNNPKTFNEKLQWLKLYDRKPEYTQMVDKYEVKKYVASIIGHDFIIPTLGVWDRVSDIDWDSLPNQFVLKTTHGSGGSGVVICKDKNNFDKNVAIKKIQKSLLYSDTYAHYREWPYKNIQRRIIAEVFINDTNSKELKDYKFFCFNGKVRFFKVDFGRFKEHHANYYDLNKNLLPFGEYVCLPKNDYDVDIPQNLNQMVEVAENLSRGIPFLRVDLYNVHNHIFFGEMTFYPASGMGPFVPASYDLIIGNYLNMIPWRL